MPRYYVPLSPVPFHEKDKVIYATYRGGNVHSPLKSSQEGLLI